jgi:hypothetical protein
MNAPIILFVYNRPWHTRNTVEALQKNTLASQSDLYIFSDGAKRKKDEGNVEKVRSYVSSITGFKSVTIKESGSNKGLAKSIIEGVTELLSQSDSVIILEDDLVTSPYFLSFMNQALNVYNDDDRVVCINGYFYPSGADLPQSFFLRGADCQGWATWKRAWSLFNPNGKFLLGELKRKRLCREFNYNNSYNFTRMLDRQQKGLIESWAIRWYASAFIQGKLTLYPGQSFIKNIGFDNSGTNSSEWDKKRYDAPVQLNEIHLERIEIRENTEARDALARYFKRTQKPLLLKVIDRIRSIMKRLA